MSDMYAIKATTLTALGDAIRSKSSLTKVQRKNYKVNEIVKRNCENYDYISQDITYPSSLQNMPNKYNSVIHTFTPIEGASAIRVKGVIQLVKPSYHLDSVNYNFLPYAYKFGDGAPNLTNAITYTLNAIDNEQTTVKEHVDFIIEDTNVAAIQIEVNYDNTHTVAYYLEVIGLDENHNPLDNGEIIIDADMTVKNTMTPLKMVDMVNNIPKTPDEALTITGPCSYRFSYNGWNWFIDTVGDKITTDKIDSATYMFYMCDKLESIPFELNMNDSFYGDMSSMFYGCKNLKDLPKINNAYPSNINGLFQGCNNIKEISDDYCETWNFSRINSYSSAKMNNLFNGMNRLRKIPSSLLKNIWGCGTSSTYSPYPTLFSACYVLDEVNGIAVNKGKSTSNCFSNTISQCFRLKEFIFETNEDGTPQTAQWKSQTIDLSSNVGYSNYTDLVQYGVSADKEVKDDATYQALKNDENWWSQMADYSRYNHDSAVRTINSLPDCSATGTNTIKFKGAAGALTDGGAINTLTAEEIAVAAAKGWTVTLA